MRNFFFILIVLFVISGCDKRNNAISWTTRMSIPISKDSLFINDFINVNNVLTSPNQDYYYVRDTLNLFELNQNDFLPDLDFSFSESLSFPLVFSIPPNQIAPVTLPSNHQFDFQDLQLHEILFNRLSFNYSATSNIDGNFFLIIHLPGALKENGDLFYDTVEIQNNNGNNSSFIHQIEIENLRIDLSNNGSTYNTISTTFQIMSGNDTIPPNLFSNVNLNIELANLDVAYMRGYFGNITVSNEVNTNINALKKLASNNIQLYQPELEIIIKNGVGMDAQLTINEIEFQRNQSSRLLSHNSIGQSVNISRAQDLGWDFNYSSQSIYISEQNSNLNEIINLFPTLITSTYQLETNPQGNHAGFNDFYYTNKPLSIDAAVTLPLLFNVDSLVFSDTFSIEFPEILHINEANLDLEIENGLPLSVCFDLSVLNGNHINMTQPCLFHSNLDSNNQLFSPSFNQLSATLDSTNSSILLEEKKIVLNATIYSPDTTTFFPVLLSDWLNYKVGLTLNADINIE